MLYLKTSKNLSRIIATPFLFILIIPIIVLDIFIEIYHHTCFPSYKLPLVKRTQHVKIDRHRLPYLSFLQKIGCVYCGYTNGIINYWVEIAAQTEEFFCGIQHQKSKNFISPQHHSRFTQYGDRSEFKREYQ